MNRWTMGVAAVLVGTAAQAGSYTDLCLEMSETMQHVATARDRGVPVEQVRAIARRAFASQPKAVPIVERMVRLIYLADGITPGQVGAQMFADCSRTFGDGAFGDTP